MTREQALKTLGLAPGATAAQIEAAYRSRARQRTASLNGSGRLQPAREVLRGRGEVSTPGLHLTPTRPCVRPEGCQRQVDRAMEATAFTDEEIAAGEALFRRPWRFLLSAPRLEILPAAAGRRSPSPAAPTSASRA